MTGGSSGDAYGGLLGAFPYAFRASESWLFRSYVAAGGLLALVVSLFFLLGLVVTVGQTLARGGVFTFVRAFVIFVGFLVVTPLLAPVLAVARRHRRRDRGSTARYDLLMGTSGYLYAAATFVGLVISIPDCFELDGEQVCPTAEPGAFQPVVAFLYDLPEAGSVLPPLAAVGLMILLHRRTG